MEQRTYFWGRMRAPSGLRPSDSAPFSAILPFPDHPDNPASDLVVREALRIEPETCFLRLTRWEKFSKRRKPIVFGTVDAMKCATQTIDLVSYCPACRGEATTTRKAATSRANGKLGGRPPGSKSKSKPKPISMLRAAPVLRAGGCQSSR